MTTNKATFKKTLTVNDTGQSGSHQDGTLNPNSDLKGQEFLPDLELAEKF